MPAISSGGSAACRSRVNRDAIPKPVSRTRLRSRVDEDLGRPDVLVDEAPPVHLAEGYRNPTAIRSNVPTSIGVPRGAERHSAGSSRTRMVWP